MGTHKEISGSLGGLGLLFFETSLKLEFELLLLTLRLGEMLVPGRWDELEGEFVHLNENGSWRTDM